MRIDRLGLALRARSSWEAVDLGFALARHHAGAWLLPWWLAGGLLASLLLGMGHALGAVSLVPLVLWWLKPALDRVPLFVLSRAVFGRVPTRAETLRAALSWGWGPTIPRLLWLRFDPFRALSMPSDLLEGLPRRERGLRRERLRREGAGQAVALWLLIPWFELVLVASVWALLGLMIPLEWWEARGGSWFESAASATGEVAWLDTVQAALTCVAILALEPFFAAAGFGLYLSRRVHLEAWDLELGFKRMAARAAAAGRGAVGAAGALMLLIGVAFGPAFASPAQAGKPEPAAEVKADRPPIRLGASALPAGFTADDAADRARLEAALRDVRRDPSMGGTEDVTRWRLKPSLVPEWSPSPSAERAFNWKEALGRWMGVAVGVAAELALSAVVLALLVWAAWRFRDWLPWRRERAAATATAPALRHRALTPEDVAAAPEWLRRARAAWLRGEAREAMACLYRAGLGEVSARRTRPLAPGTTEGELLRAARGLAHAPARDHVVRLVAAWRAVAYAGHSPLASDFDALVAAWPDAFGEARA